MDDVRSDYDKNEAEVLKFLTFHKWKDFSREWKRSMALLEKNYGNCFPSEYQKSGDVILKLNEDLELRKSNCEWQENFKGLFGLLKQNNLEGKNKNGNWFHRTVFKCDAIQCAQTTVELFLVMKSRHLNFFESLIQANI